MLFLCLPLVCGTAVPCGKNTNFFKNKSKDSSYLLVASLEAAGVSGGGRSSFDIELLPDTAAKPGWGPVRERRIILIVSPEEEKSHKNKLFAEQTIYAETF